MGPYVMSKEQSEKVTDLTLKELGVTKDNLERLQTIPYETLAAASRKALKTVGTEYKVPQALGTGYGLSWEPVVDGDFLPTNPVTETGFAEAGRKGAAAHWDQLDGMDRVSGYCRRCGPSV